MKSNISGKSMNTVFEELNKLSSERKSLKSKNKELSSAKEGKYQYLSDVATEIGESYYQHHLFFCCNQRAEGGTCCANADAEAAQTYAKDRIGELKLKGRGKVRISKSGCMGRCGDGPVLVVYPEGVWYRYASVDDVEAIIQEHLLNGRPVERLRLAS